MKAMLLRACAPLTQNPRPLSLEDLPEPAAGAGEVLIKVTACGVCHTELDEIEGRMQPRLPIILGHQAVGVLQTGEHKGQRVGVAWIASACGKCKYCLSGNENLCAGFTATGRDVNGGYAEYMTARADYLHPLPASLSDGEAAPLLCAGAIGYRSLRLANLRDGESLGLAGFGASAHLVLKMVNHKYPRSAVFVFSRNPEEQEFALSLGAVWAGAIEAEPPQLLKAVIDTTPAWGPIHEALKHLIPGGRLVINAIRKQEQDKQVLLSLDYPSQLWMEKEIKSVANVTRQDVREFLQLADQAGLRPEFQEYDLKDANRALSDMKSGRNRGAKVLRI